MAAAARKRRTEEDVVFRMRAATVSSERRRTHSLRIGFSIFVEVICKRIHCESAGN